MHNKRVPTSSHLPTPKLFTWEQEPYAFFENGDDFPFDPTIGTHNAENAWWLAELSLLSHYQASVVEGQLSCIRQFRQCDFHWISSSQESGPWSSGGFLLVAPSYSVLVLRGLAPVNEQMQTSNIKTTDLVQCALPVLNPKTCDATFRPVLIPTKGESPSRDAKNKALLLSLLEQASVRSRSPSSPMSTTTPRVPSNNRTSPPVISPRIQINGTMIIPRVNGTFYEMSQHIWTQLQDILPLNRPLFITGHGVGGALATLTAFQYQGIVRAIYTFGSPAVGCSPFSNAFSQAGLNTKCYRYVHGRDIVATSHSTLQGIKKGANNLSQMSSTIVSQFSELPGSSIAKSIVSTGWIWASDGISKTLNNTAIGEGISAVVDSVSIMSTYCHVGQLKHIERSDDTRSMMQRVFSSVLRHDLTDHSPFYYATLTWNNIPGKDARRGLTASIRNMLIDSKLDSRRLEAVQPITFSEFELDSTSSLGQSIFGHSISDGDYNDEENALTPVLLNEDMKGNNNINNSYEYVNDIQIVPPEVPASIQVSSQSILDVLCTRNNQNPHDIHRNSDSGGQRENKNSTVQLQSPISAPVSPASNLNRNMQLLRMYRVMQKYGKNRVTKSASFS